MKNLNYFLILSICFGLLFSNLLYAQSIKKNTLQDISKYYDLHEDGKVKTFSSKEEGEKKMKEYEDKINNFHSSLKTTSTELPTNIDHPMYGLNYFVQAKIPEYYSDFTYGCGRDPNGGDSILTQADLNTMRSLGMSANPLRDGTWWMDIDRDGVSNTTLDQEKVIKFLGGDLSQISVPGLETRLEAEENFLKELAIDWTSDINAYAANWVCHDFGTQTFINFTGIYAPQNSPFAQDNGTNLQYDFSANGVFGRPFRRVATKNSSGTAHEIVVLYNGPKEDQNPKNFNYKIYVEPQNDEIQEIGDRSLNEYAYEVWHGYFNHPFEDWGYIAISLCEYNLNNGEATLCFSDPGLVTSWNPFDSTGVEGKSVKFPTDTTIEYTSGVESIVEQYINNSEITDLLYPNETQVNKTSSSNRNSDPNNPNYYNYDVNVLWELTAGAYNPQNTPSAIHNQKIEVRDTEAPVRNPTTGEVTDNSEGPITHLEETVIEDVCKPDTIITHTWKDVVGNESEPYVEIKEAPAYTGVPYLTSPDAHVNDTIQLTLGQAETPANIGGLPDFIDDETEVTITYEIEELQWAGNGWYKKISFEAQNDCGNVSPTKVERTYFKPSGTAIEDIQMEPALQIYPNPASQFIYIKRNFGSTYHYSFTIEIIDITGKILWKKEDNNTDLEIDISDYPAGLYILKMYDNNQIFRQQKIIIQ